MTKIQNIKTILMGTSEFAEKIFRNFQPWADQPRAGYQFEIVAVVTAEDKPKGRKQTLTPSPVKLWAQENNLPVLQPDKIRKPEWIEKIKDLAPDLIILCAYGQIIPQEILDIPEYKALNIHPSLLPCWRGASPIQSVILSGEKETGVCLMIMDAEMDHGPILGISKFKILNPKIPYKDLENQLIVAASDLLIKTLPEWIEGKIQPQEQDHAQATICKLIKKEHGKIDWNKSTEEIERQIRAFAEWPESYTIFNGKQLKIIDADIVNKKTDNEIGKVFLDENKNLCVQTGNGTLILKQVQPESKKPMSSRDFLNGHPEIIGTILK